jgi:acyl-CoA dehydrogenase
VDLDPSPRGRALLTRMRGFLREDVEPAEQAYAAEAAAGASHGDRHAETAVMVRLKDRARELGLWNLFLPEEVPSDLGIGGGVSVLDYAHLAELTGRSPLLAPEATNGAAPDTGNMELLLRHGTQEQQRRWLPPLLAGEMRSTFLMTEPAVASSDPHAIATTVRREGEELVIDGLKWWSSGAAGPRCHLAIVMGVSEADAPRGRRHSMVLVPMDTPGVEVVREVPVFGRLDAHGGHPEVRLTGVRVPVTDLLGPAGEGFSLAQARLGPGRIHHCMRLIGMAERALELLCRRSHERSAFGRPLAEQGIVQHWIAQSRVRIDQARLLTLRAAWRIDHEGVRAARDDISAIKLVVPATALWVLDHAIQAHGGAGVSDDTPLAMMWAHARTLRIADGPDEVHAMVIARRELARHAPSGPAAWVSSDPVPPSVT